MAQQSERYVLIKSAPDGTYLETEQLRDLQEALDRMEQLRCSDLHFEYYVLDTVLKKKILSTPDPGEVS